MKIRYYFLGAMIPRLPFNLIILQYFFILIVIFQKNYLINFIEIFDKN